MLIESSEWKQVLVESYQRLNEMFKRNPKPTVAMIIQEKIDIIGHLLKALVQIEQKGDSDMAVEYADLIKKMVSVEELKQRTRHTKLTEAVLGLAKAVKESKEKAAYIDSKQVSYPTLYRKITDMKESGELEKAFFIGKRGNEFFLGYDPQVK